MRLKTSGDSVKAQVMFRDEGDYNCQRESQAAPEACTSPRMPPLLESTYIWPPAAHAPLPMARRRGTGSR